MADWVERVGRILINNKSTNEREEPIDAASVFSETSSKKRKASIPRSSTTTASISTESSMRTRNSTQCHGKTAKRSKNSGCNATLNNGSNTDSLETEFDYNDQASKNQVSVE